MVDRFVERTANLAELTCRTLDEIAKVQDEAGLPHGEILRQLARQHKQMLIACLTETQPIEVPRYRTSERIETSIRSLRDLSADLLARGKEGHNEIEEAADLLQLALEKNQHD